MSKPNWIRIIVCGTVSSLTALLLGATLLLTQDMACLCLVVPGAGAVGPAALFKMLLHLEELPRGIFYLVNATTWFIIGAIIGRKTEKNSSAILLWIGANVISFIIYFLASRAFYKLSLLTQ